MSMSVKDSAILFNISKFYKEYNVEKIIYFMMQKILLKCYTGYRSYTYFAKEQNQLCNKSTRYNFKEGFNKLNSKKVYTSNLRALLEYYINYFSL